MCTRARLVQAEKTTAWFGMPMSAAATQTANILLESDQPAYLEASIDPAAHGEAALGPIMRVVTLNTAAGQTLEFELRANVVR